MSNALPIDFAANRSISPSTLSEVVTSYRRSQTFLSSSNITTHDGFPEQWRRDETSNLPHEYDEEANDSEISATVDDTATPQPIDVSDPLWDDAMQPSRSPDRRSNTNERTPLLLGRKISWQNPPSPGLDPRRPALLRRSSTRSVNSKYSFQSGNSTYKQTLFNSIAILLGIGMLSEPLAFAYAGWTTGTFLIIFYGFLTCYTAKILARIITADPKLRTYADIGYKAFGRRSTVLTGILFCLELFAVSVVLITLYADSLHLVIPALSSNQYKILGLLVLIPTVTMPLSVLSYASILGILSTTMIITCIAIDGLTKLEAPGSLWQPADTDWFVKDAGKVGISFGLFMAGFSGHAVIPSLARDMQDPTQFDNMINWAFGIATIVYGLIGAAGYLMFGRNVSEEVSKDILATPGYNIILNELSVWMLVVAPLSKFALSIRPLNLTLEIWLGIDNPAPASSASRPASPTSKSAAVLATSPRTTPHPSLLVAERITLTLLSTGVSILVPQFSTVMAFLGSFSAFVLCVIGPICAKVAIEGRCSWYDGILLAVSIMFAIWGTIAAFQ